VPAGVGQLALDAHGALVAAISSYLLFRELKNDKWVGGSLNLIYVAIASHMDLEHKPDRAKMECSFCGRDGTEVRLGAGPSAFICHDCATTMATVLAPPA
jgi:hypothetical protein